MKIAILDGYSINPGDLSWNSLKSFAEIVCYDRTSENQLPARMSGMDGIFVSKCKITREIMHGCPNLKFIGVTATGYDNIDLEAAEEKGISVFNTPAYSTEAVAQHTFAFILELFNHVGEYSSSVNSGDWQKSIDFCYTISPLSLLEGKSLGIVGYGRIGKKVAEIGKAFGMKINIYSEDIEATVKSDIVSLHCPLTKENYGLINKEFISKMKDGAIIINTARGGLVNSEDLARALVSGKLSGAGIDVLEDEPPIHSNPLIGLKNCLVTPHIAWMPIEARAKVIQICRDNLESFLKGEKTNRIV